MKQVIKLKDVVGPHLRGQDALKFRDTYLSFMDTLSYWRSCKKIPLLDFDGVRSITPSFVSNVFGYFTMYASPDQVEHVFMIGIQNISQVQRVLISKEIRNAWDFTYSPAGEYLEGYLI